MTIQAYQQVKFLTSVARLNQLPLDQGVEVAFAGRSNAGKSTALNCLTQQRRLARTSKTPGRTQMINLFTIDESRRIVDLPGYGFAKVPLAVKAQWQQLLGHYLEQRVCLAGLVLLMDIRHPLKPLDETLIEWASHRQLPVHILLTKMDKLKFGAQKQTLQQVQTDLKAYPGELTIQLFSGLTSTGVDVLAQRLDDWFQLYG